MTFKVFTKLSLLSYMLCLCIGVPYTYAASYTVAPLVIDKDLEGRDSITETITLTNTSDSPLRIFPTVNEVKVKEGGTIETFLEPSMIQNRETAITSWIEITRSRIELAPKESKEITMSVRVHPEAPAGEYHAFLGFPTGANRPEAEKAVYSGSVPGSVLRIGVDQKQSQFLRLAHFSVTRFVKDATKDSISYTLANPGDDAVVPEGEIIFYSNRGIEMGAIEVNPTKVTIEGGKEASFTAKVPESLALGKYKAFLSVEFGIEQRTSIHDTAFFYVIPFEQLLLIFGSIVIVAIIVALLLHRRYGRYEEDETVSDVGLYIRQSRSEPKEHDIDLTKK